MHRRATSPLPQEARKLLSIQRCSRSLVHACQCRDAICKLPSCQKMKRVVQHTKICKRKTYGGCPICKQIIGLCCYHAKHCQETNNCPMPFCLNIKQKLKQQEIRQFLQLARELTRRCMAMATPTAPAMGFMTYQSLVQQAAMSGTQSYQAGTQGPPVSVLQAFSSLPKEEKKVHIQTLLELMNKQHGLNYELTQVELAGPPVKMFQNLAL